MCTSYPPSCTHLTRLSTTYAINQTRRCTLPRQSRQSCQSRPLRTPPRRLGKHRARPQLAAFHTAFSHDAYLRIRTPQNPLPPRRRRGNASNNTISILVTFVPYTGATSSRTAISFQTGRRETHQLTLHSYNHTRDIGGGVGSICSSSRVHRRLGDTTKSSQTLSCLYHERGWGKRGGGESTYVAGWAALQSTTSVNTAKPPRLA
ncbi:hypothetical protein F4803DRAFT_39458 [Xylaria telfairii]|nr:hypothetical protein F4803DRAFT_39458 [Xylaria telfairii]